MINAFDFKNIKTGESICLQLTEQEATSLAEAYFKKHATEIRELISGKFKVSFDITEPVINFEEDELAITVKAGMKFLKASARAAASVIWNGSKAQVNVKSLDLPIIKLEASEANGLIQQPIQSFVDQIQKDLVIRSFKIRKGSVLIDAVKK